METTARTIIIRKTSIFPAQIREGIELQFEPETIGTHQKVQLQMMHNQ
jgi:hypothetical protein